MDIDARFIITSDLDSYFVDKDSGAPLSGGIVTFYNDTNVNVLKDVFQLTGQPGNYSYAPLPNPCILSDVGTFQDALGNNIVPYYYPFTSTPTANTGVVELYFITVKDANGVPQFDRHAWPNYSSSGGSATGIELENFIPNGQFVYHNQIIEATPPASGTIFPPIATLAFGSTTLANQEIAQGGWLFQRINGGLSTFTNNFERISGAVSGIFDFPRYAFNFICTGFNATDTVRDLAVKWLGVYTFSAGDPTGTQDYTLYLTGSSNDANTYVFTVWLTYYYGTGGSPSTPSETQLGSFNIIPGYQKYTLNIHGFGTPTGNLGTNNDDYVSISLRGPSSSFSAQFTDFALVLGNVNVNAFPTMTINQMQAEGIAGWMNTPTFDGMQFYLPLVLTATGMAFDNSRIGTILADMKLAPVLNTLACDGTQYATDAYSALGIPYSRLLDAGLWDSTLEAPVFGTGSTFVTGCLFSGLPQYIILSTNQAGLQTYPADGFVATGFGFLNTAPNANNGVSGNYGYNVYANYDGVVTFEANNYAAILGLATAGTTGIGDFASFNEGLVNSRYGFRFVCGSGAAMGNGGGVGKYILFSSNAVNYCMWFFTSAETAPAVGRTNIQINLNVSMTAREVAFVIANTMSSHQTSLIGAIAGASITNSSYFTFNSNSQIHVVWFDKGGGTQPVVAGAVDYIKVTITNAYTNAQVAFAMMYHINRKYYCVPDARGVFLRGADISNYDIGYAYRWFKNNISQPGLRGSFEAASSVYHNHSFSYTYQTTDAVLTFDHTAGGAGQFVEDLTHTTPTTSSTTGTSGYYETVPVNMAVNWVIVY